MWPLSFIFLSADAFPVILTWQGVMKICDGLWHKVDCPILFLFKLGLKLVFDFKQLQCGQFLAHFQVKVTVGKLLSSFSTLLPQIVSV